MKEQLIYGIHTIAAFLDKQPQNILSVFVQQDRLDAQTNNVVAQAKKNSIAVQPISKEKLAALLPDVNHQGVAAKVSLIVHSENDLEKIITSLIEPAFLLILDGVQDPHNLGACLRSANAAGVHAVIVPKNNATGLTPIVHKVASGAAAVTPFIQVTNLARTLGKLKELGIWIYGTSSIAKKSLYSTDLKGPIALVLGGEGKGLRRLTEEYCDEILSIPTRGTVESINVSVATGICLFEALRQRSS